MPDGSLTMDSLYLAIDRTYLFKIFSQSDQSSTLLSCSIVLDGPSSNILPSSFNKDGDRKEDEAVLNLLLPEVLLSRAVASITSIFELLPAHQIQIKSLIQSMVLQSQESRLQ